MENIKLETVSGSSVLTSTVVQIVRHSVPLETSFLNNRAVLVIHALEEDTAVGSGEEYISQLARSPFDSEARIKSGESEIPDREGLSQGDHYCKSYFCLLFESRKIEPKTLVCARTPRASLVLFKRLVRP
jgi:hypothetical protein